MATSSVPKLFQPIRVGTTNLKHRVVLAPMTRCRADAQYVPGHLIQEYYKQRTSVPGTVLLLFASKTERSCFFGITAAVFPDKRKKFCPTHEVLTPRQFLRLPADERA